MAFIPLKDFWSIWHFKLPGLIGPRAMSERVKGQVIAGSDSVGPYCAGPDRTRTLYL
jgi:hypothetical protein